MRGEEGREEGTFQTGTKAPEIKENGTYLKNVKSYITKVKRNAGEEISQGLDWKAEQRLIITLFIPEVTWQEYPHEILYHSRLLCL